MSDAKAGAALASLQVRLQLLEEKIHLTKEPAQAVALLDEVRKGIHEINGAYFDYAHYAWAAKNLSFDTEQPME
jgi:hypothetical protein